MGKTNYSVARVVTYTKQSIGKAERHNERKNKVYSNMNVDLEQTKNNVHYKTCNTTYNERLKELVDTGTVSLRGLKDNAKVFDELVLDINSDYFEKHGGYDFAKKFYEEAYHFAEKEYGKDNIISAVMHADEQNIALTEEYGKPIYHYHLHVIALPVVKKEIKYSKRTKDKSLVGKVKETIMQVSHSKKWKSQKALDNEGNEILNDKGKPVLIKSYSLLQDRFYKYMSDNGYKDFIRGEKGSNAEHLSDLEYKAKKEKEKLQAITDKVKEQQAKFAENASAIEETKKQKNQVQQELNDIKKDVDDYKSYKGDIDNIDVGKSKFFGKKIELDNNDYQNLVKYAKKGVVADVEITKLKDENIKLKHDFNELKEKTRDFIRAIAYAPTKVMNFFKSLFKEEEQEKQRQLELAEQQRLEKLYTPAEREILANITDYDKEYLNRFEGETRERIERGLIEEYEKELRYKEKINSSEYKKRRADRDAR
ncbi:MAG TPA: plasmid recombination enzyme [Clostridiales bacterium]|nr:plasmid recombination enzyme [Clostridiales bacterium]